MIKYTFLFSLTIFIFTSCSNQNDTTAPTGKAVKTSSSFNDNFNKYWYAGEAEISSYELKQARYGEIHEGKAAMIFVTEHFSPKNGTKANNPNIGDATPILKLNNTKKFNTGIYPYSMMTSTFFPVKEGNHSFAITSSSQEWCGHSYMELANKSKFEVTLESYFEGESFSNLSLAKDNLEDDIWTKIRINPLALPVGEIKMIPSFFYLRLRHRATKAYECSAVLNKVDKTFSEYQLTYPALNRTLNIQFENVFPYKIISWEEAYPSGFGSNAAQLKTTATLIKTIKSDYWNRNSNKDRALRKELQLD